MQHGKNVSFLTQLLKNRLALSNDALKINHNNPCREHENDSKTCTKENCPALSETPLQQRVEDLVLAPQFQLSDHDLKTIFRVVSAVREADIIIASASSSNHFKEMQAMFKALHSDVYPKLTNFSVVLFDIGLKKRQLKLTKKYCKCQVIRFPFELFPPHVADLHCYSWKAIIIRSLMSKARKLLIYQDTSIRWTDNFLTVFKRAAKYGQQVYESTNSARIPSHTLQQMFDYMGEKACQYFAFGEIQCGFQVLKNDPLIIEAVLNPWTKCALEQFCICPVNSKQVLHCNDDDERNSSDPICHRFDQSAMSIILSKLYAEERYKITLPEYSKKDPKFVAVRRGHRTNNYFSRQRFRN